MYGVLKSWRWLTHLAVGLIALPFIVHQNSWYEWANALWLLDLQTAHVAAHGIPTYFIDAPNQYFYPNYVFYGGTAFSFLAYPAVVFGTWPVFAASTAGAFIAASAGLSWTARNLGVPSRLAVLPGVLFALTPYTVSNLYGRGAWTELLAVGALGVALGAATSLTSGRARNRPITIAVLALAVAAIAGTHNITLLFSALLAPLLALALLPLLHDSKRELMHRHLLVLAGVATGVAICGVFLIPDIWLSGRTVASEPEQLAWGLRQIRAFDSLRAIFDPLLGQPPGTVGSDLHTQTLVLPLVWLVVIGTIGVSWRWIDRRASTALALIGLIGAAITLLIAHPSWWLSFPSMLQAIQYPFRLVSFLGLLTALGIIALLATPKIQGNRLAVGVLLLITAWQAGLAIDLAVTSKARGEGPRPTPANISASVIPPAFRQKDFAAKQFRLVVQAPLFPTGGLASVEQIGDDTPSDVVLFGSQPSGSLVETSVVLSPLIRVTGQATLAGVSSEGYAVLRVTGGGRSIPWRATVTSVCTTCLGGLTGGALLALLIGRFTSVVGVLALCGLIIAGIRTRRR